MELNKYEKKYKEFIKARERLDKVEEELGKLPTRPLKEPFQRGWEVTIRLRDDIARRSDAPLIHNLLGLGYSKCYVTQSLDDVKAIRRGEKSIPYIDWRGRRSTRSLVPSKLRLTEKEYDTFPPNIQKYMDFDRICETYRRWGRKTFYLYIPDYWIQLKARPNIVTHQYIKGGELERERDELRSFLEEYWREWCSRGGGSWKDKWSDGRKETKDKLRKVMKGELEDIN